MGPPGHPLGGVWSHAGGVPVERAVFGGVLPGETAADRLQPLPHLSDGHGLSLLLHQHAQFYRGQLLRPRSLAGGARLLR